MNAAVMSRHVGTGTMTKGPTTPGGTEQTIISSFACDRDNDTVDPRGADLENFKKNGPVLFGHRSNELPAGKPNMFGWTRRGICA